MVVVGGVVVVARVRGTKKSQTTFKRKERKETCRLSVSSIFISVTFCLENSQLFTVRSYKHVFMGEAYF